MTHMRFRSSQLCWSIMRFNVSAFIFHHRADIRISASQKIISAGELAPLMVPIRCETRDFLVNFRKGFNLWVFKESFAQVPKFRSRFLIIVCGIILIYQRYVFLSISAHFCLMLDSSMRLWQLCLRVSTSQRKNKGQTFLGGMTPRG